MDRMIIQGTNLNSHLDSVITKCLKSKSELTSNIYIKSCILNFKCQIKSKWFYDLTLPLLVVVVMTECYPHWEGEEEAVSELIS